MGSLFTGGMQVVGSASGLASGSGGGGRGFLGMQNDASLISRAVRIRAIRVEVKCTVRSSAMGMFILTNRWRGRSAAGTDKQRGTHAAPRGLLLLL
ncbi:hypothetical protein EYF80_030081 [Liparis tanakae]|uniref:Uncharacterized protein n=1 Tax=Liparis tanakae TaxID=230148 RepID=A0A4Z2H2M5_9TELE|nr:hypothetical protein EYF80_030081 [Liparis tanakae]